MIEKKRNRKSWLERVPKFQKRFVYKKKTFYLAFNTLVYVSTLDGAIQNFRHTGDVK